VVAAARRELGVIDRVAQSLRRRLRRFENWDDFVPYAQSAHLANLLEDWLDDLERDLLPTVQEGPSSCSRPSFERTTRSSGAWTIPMETRVTSSAALVRPGRVRRPHCRRPSIASTASTTSTQRTIAASATRFSTKRGAVVVAVLCSRALTDQILAAGRSSAYGPASRYCRELERLEGEMEREPALVRHVESMAGLRERHGREWSFWKRLEETPRRAPS